MDGCEIRESRTTGMKSLIAGIYVGESNHSRVSERPQYGGVCGVISG